MLVTSEERHGGFSNVASIKHYRERADAEPERSGDSQPLFSKNCWHNIIDEVKNQWGWCGFTTRKIGPSRIMASFIALIYNGWHLYCRFYDETHNREAICADLRDHPAALSPLRSGSTRPALMQGVGRRVESGGQKRIKVSILHQKADVITAAITAISKEISRLATAAEQWTIEQSWLLLLVRIYRHYFGGKRPAGFLPTGELLLSG